MNANTNEDPREKGRADINHKGRKEMKEAIELRQERLERWQKEGERPLWKNLSMIGALGWLMVAPTLLGVAAGRWIDNRLGTGVQFSGALIFLGACLGFYLVCKRMNEK
ncbi:ATPase F0F1 [Stappia sp. GBMRC 2046]|uniref:ATPase F0F1 n=1 Tax=Stappia sediminis TaxID=2692190 RepID=A0A7X3S9V8_9HYPH|nr:AtpZ/AtpI family protein [Stappia sediminis]MXN67288.1 ATPase F0F1 [Stappia sediminis]